MAVDLRNQIIGQTFVSGEFTFASGAHANNKIDMKLLCDNPELFSEVVLRLGTLAMIFTPDLITYIPNGAKMFAEPVASRLNLPLAHLWKASDLAGQRGGIFYRRPMDYKSVQTARRVVIVEDVTREFTSTKRVLGLPYMKEKAVGQASILHRGWPSAQQNFGLNSRSLIGEHIPELMEGEQLATFERLAERFQ